MANTLMPNLSDALLVHSQAHEAQSGELHEVALKLLALSGQTHICTDGLDEQSESTVWDELPGAVLVEDEAAGLYLGYKQAVVATDSDEVVVALTERLGGVRVVNEGYYQHKSRTPVYEKWLIRKDVPEAVEPECPYIIGEYVTVGHPRMNGGYKFPAVAQKVGENYQMLQVHKDGDTVNVFDKDGRQPRGMAAVIDAFVAIDSPSRGIFEVLYDEGVVKWWDVVTVDGIDCMKMPYNKRIGLLIVADAGMVEIGGNTECVVVDSQSVYGLEKGKWLLRYQGEVIEDLARPFWFQHFAGTVRVHKPLSWVCPSESVDDPSGYLCVEDTGLPLLQVHYSAMTGLTDERRVKVFMAEGGRDWAKKMPQIVEMAKQFKQDVILECAWTCEKDGQMLDVQAVRKMDDFGDCEIVLKAFDIALWGNETLVEKTMDERVEILERVLEDIEGVELGIGDCAGSCLCFEADAVRPLNGDSGHCFKFG